jgi:hypothetical protein
MNTFEEIIEVIVKRVTETVLAQINTDLPGIVKDEVTTKRWSREDLIKLIKEHAGEGAKRDGFTESEKDEIMTIVKDEVDFKDIVNDVINKMDLAEELEIDSKITSAIEDQDIERTVEGAVESAIEDMDLSDAVQKEIGDYDFAEIIEDAISKGLAEKVKKALDGIEVTLKTE